MEIKDIEKVVTDGVAPLKTNIDEIKAKQTDGEKTIKELQDQLKALKDQGHITEEHKDTLEKTIKAVEDMQIALKQQQTQKIEQKGFGVELFEALKGREEELKNYKKNRQQINIELKAVGNIGASNFTTSGTPGWVNPTDMGYVPLAFNPTHFRNILGTQAVQTDTITVIRDAGGEGAPTTVAVAGLKPQSDRDWVKVVVPITKIAHWYRIPEEYLNDISWLQGEITRIGTEELLAVEDAEIYSNNTAGEFTGLVQNSTAWAAPAELAASLSTVNPYDVLVSAWTQANQAKKTITNHLLNHGDFAKMILSKATDGQYLFGPNQAFPNVLGVPVTPINQIGSDKFISLNRNAATIAVREGISVRFYDQDGDNARYNLVTVVIEERIALVVRDIKSVIYGDFSDATTALEPAP